MSLNLTLKDIAPEDIIEASKRINRVSTAVSGASSTVSSVLENTANGVEAIGRTIKSRDVIFIPGDEITFETLFIIKNRVLDILVDCDIVPIFFSQRFLPTLKNFAHECILAIQNNEKSKKSLQVTAKNAVGVIVQLAVVDLVKTKCTFFSGLVKLALQLLVFPWLISGIAFCPYSEETNLKAKMNPGRLNEFERKMDQKCRTDIIRKTFSLIELGSCLNFKLCSILGPWPSLLLGFFLLLKLLESANFFEIN